MADIKTRQNEGSVEDFLISVPNEQRRRDGFVLLDLMKRVTRMEPKMWGPSIIGFGSYHYKYESGREGDMPLAAFSPRKQSMTLYLISGFKEYDRLLDKLGKHKTGVACLYINKLSDVDPAVLEELVTRSFNHMHSKNPE